MANFEHILYCQIGDRDVVTEYGWEESESVATDFMNIEQTAWIVAANELIIDWSWVAHTRIWISFCSVYYRREHLLIFSERFSHQHSILRDFLTNGG